MKTPYVRITAVCTVHGQFTVDKKPNRNRSESGSRLRDGFYHAVKCPRCPFWADITKQAMITAEPAGQPDPAAERSLF